METRNAYANGKPDKAIDTTMKAVEFVGHKAHKSPWYFIGGVAAITGIAGYVLGSKPTKH